MRVKKNKFFSSWFYKWLVNNQAVSFLLVILLILLNLFLFTKVGYVVKPIVSFLEIILLPMILTGLLYYLLNPVVDWLERLKLSPACSPFDALDAMEPEALTASKSDRHS